MGGGGGRGESDSKMIQFRCIQKSKRESKETHLQMHKHHCIRFPPFRPTFYLKIVFSSRRISRCPAATPRCCVVVLALTRNYRVIATHRPYTASTIASRPLAHAALTGIGNPTEVLLAFTSARAPDAAASAAPHTPTTRPTHSLLPPKAYRRTVVKNKGGQPYEETSASTAKGHRFHHRQATEICFKVSVLLVLLS